tara:strand:- start:233 stop:370 length:138 start_codon:yes stop_codon:yes gene_type:complete
VWAVWQLDAVPQVAEWVTRLDEKQEARLRAPVTRLEPERQEPEAE